MENAKLSRFAFFIVGGVMVGNAPPDCGQYARVASGGWGLWKEVGSDNT